MYFKLSNTIYNWEYSSKLEKWKGSIFRQKLWKQEKETLHKQISLNYKLYTFSFRQMLIM